MSIVHDRIRERRENSGKTLLQMAEFLGVKEATAQRYESGSIKNLKYETVSQIASFFNCDPSYLMGWTDDPRPADVRPRKLSAKEESLLNSFAKLNDEGQEKAAGYVDDLVYSGRYEKKAAVDSLDSQETG